ncbi:MAG: hypothetical protein JXR36_13995 [Bacteroidales bacterium]|nr:hypothetical protein [Bacteroidales bacterium]
MESQENMQNKKILTFKITISSIAIILLVFHLIFPTFLNDNFSFILLLLILLPWINIIVKKIELFGVSVDLNPPDDAKQSYPVETYDSNGTNEKNKLVIINFKESKNFYFDHTSKNILFINARINHPQEAGAGALIKITVNKKVLTDKNLLSKPNERIIGDGRTSLWYNARKESFIIPYSPDFKANYFSDKYRVINGDAYNFKFNISQIVSDNGKYCVQIVHTGDSTEDQYKNAIIIREIGVE